MEEKKAKGQKGINFFIKRGMSLVKYDKKVTYKKL